MDSPQHRPPVRERETVFCHECENEWYRDEHGLTCPECHSDFTEIIEEANDPRADLFIPDDESDDPHDGRPSNSSRGSPNPWASIPDPEEGNINEFHWQSNGPGHYTLHGTFYGNLGGRGIGGTQNQNQNQNPQRGVAQDFMTMLQSIIGNHRMAGTNAGEHREEQTQDRPGHIRVIQGAGPGHSFTYTSTARLYPRDANNPARLEPLDDLNAILATMFGPPGQHPNQPEGHLPPINPLAALVGHFLNPGGIHGDAVYSQEALDRVISRLMEQNASGNAPGPASSDDIASLPKRKVTIEDLGTDGKAECSICIDEVEVGDEVTVLPCTHWFHGQCVGMWLSEHDTCPHCRKGISNHAQPGANTNINTSSGTNNPNTGSSTSAQHSYPSPFASPAQHQPPPHSYPPSPSPRPFPFASSIYNPVSPFDASPSSSAAGTAGGSFVHSSSDAQVRQRPQSEQRSRSDNSVAHGDGSGASGGPTIAERIRRGLFGGGGTGGGGAGGGSRN